MSVIIVIPARYASTRYPGKPLALLRGADGVAKSLVQRSWEAAMSAGGIDRVVVATDDVDALCLVPGVGKKTAARLLIELKNRLEIPDDLSGVVQAVADSPSTKGSVKGDVSQAMAGLGYSSDEIRGVLADLPDEGDVSSLVREALQRMATL